MPSWDEDQLLKASSEVLRRYPRLARLERLHGKWRDARLY
jgi:hypothetical protein